MMSDKTLPARERKEKSLRDRPTWLRDPRCSDRQRDDARILNESSSVLLFRARVTRQRRETRPVPAGRTLTTARARAKPAVPVRVGMG